MLSGPRMSDNAASALLPYSSINNRGLLDIRNMPDMKR